MRLAAQAAEGQHVDMLHVAGNRAFQFHCIGRDSHGFGQCLAAQIRLRSSCLECVGGSLFNPIRGFAEATEAGEIVDPAQQGDDEQHDSSAFTIDAGAERDDADHAEQERADEGSQHVLRGGILYQQLGGARGST